MRKSLFVSLVVALMSVLLQGCSSHSTEVEQHYETYDWQELGSSRWTNESLKPYSVLFSDRSERYRAEIVLRVDSRLDRGELTLRATLQRRGEQVYTEEVTFQLAKQAGALSAPGVVYHEYVAQLARPLQVTSAGLYDLELRLLDPSTIVGVSRVGIHLQQLR